MSDPEPPSPGLFESLGKLLRTVLSSLQNRAELFSLELREEKYRLIDLLLLAGLVLFLGAVAFLLLLTVVIFLIPAEHRILVAALAGVLCLIGAIVSAVQLKKRLRARAFAETVNQLKKDFECLTPPQ